MRAILSGGEAGVEESFTPSGVQNNPIGADYTAREGK